MPKPLQVSVGCESTPEGRVRLFLIEGESKHGIDMPAEDVAGVVVTLLAAAMHAAKISGQTRKVGGGISLAGLPCIIVLFWNFKAAVESVKHHWASETEKLIGVLPKLVAILVFGKEAWDGMRAVEIKKPIPLIPAPHPSWRGRGRDPEGRKAKICRAWERARLLLASD